MKENPIEYEGTVFYLLAGLDRYYGSHDGRVLSMRARLPRLLKPTHYRGSEVYNITLPDGECRSVSRSRISYMAQNGVEYSSLKGKTYTTKPDGTAICISPAELCRNCIRKRGESRQRDPRKWLAEGKRMIELMEHYLDTGDMNGLACEALKVKDTVTGKLTVTLRIARRTAEEITDEAIAETLWNISRGLVVFNMVNYVSALAVRFAKSSLGERKRLVKSIYTEGYFDYSV